MNGAEKFRIGDYDCWTLADGDLTYPGVTCLPPEGQPPAEMIVPYAGMLVDTGSTRVLIDTGAGPLGPNTGKLPASLAAAGFLPEDIHAVIISHAHPDHVGSLRLFPNATVFMLRPEFEFWTSAVTQARLEAAEMYGLGVYGLGHLEAVMAAYVRDHVVPVTDRLRLLDRPTEIAAGILVFPAPGHTPGHAAVLVSSGRQQLLYVGDALVHPAQFQHPDWLCAFDLAPAETVRTRKELLDRAAADRCLFAGTHLPGVLGMVEARQAAYHWEPAVAAKVSA
ncbi:MAG: MBL fold metallo-hydrolase [Bryobacteraceae bacterium]|jgi:glyoxylase-like metal-dependent hydrolase (beta-lactamase superfamily II)